MKKLVLLSFAVLLFFACSDDNKEKSNEKLNKSELTLKPGESFQLTVSNVVHDVEWSSDNPFTATVNRNGVVHSHRVGEARIHANDQVCRITVHPQYDLYRDPFMGWGASRSDLLSRLGEPDYEDDVFMDYFLENQSATNISYQFSRDRLIASSVFLSYRHTVELGAFLSERYAAVEFPDYDKDLEAVFIDALEWEDCTVVVYLYFNSEYNWMVMYIDPDWLGVKSGPDPIRKLKESFLRENR